jgi:hypothetical protein
MWIRISHGIIAKKYADDKIGAGFTPLIANDYFAKILESGFIEITKSNSEKAFLSNDKFIGLIEANELLVIEK